MTLRLLSKPSRVPARTTRRRTRQPDQLNDKSVEFTIARQEANDSRGLYQDLLKRLKEGGVLQGLRSSNIHCGRPRQGSGQA